jgi:DNA mismatch endonuclease, patch repair protein
MKGNKSSGTRPELLLAKLLRKKITKSNLPGTPDFVFPRKRIAVFMHGCFWHRCPECAIDIPKTHRAYWKNKLDRNVERDRLVRHKLESMGWKVVEVWEHELESSPTQVRERIRHLASDVSRSKALQGNRPDRRT